LIDKIVVNKIIHFGMLSSCHNFIFIKYLKSGMKKYF